MVHLLQTGYTAGHDEIGMQSAITAICMERLPPNRLLIQNGMSIGLQTFFEHYARRYLVTLCNMTHNTHSNSTNLY
jgi:hypothetical protein